MDITPQVINEVEFRQKVRGYDPDEVDDFLERMAVAVGQLQERAREAAERAAAAEQRLTEGGDRTTSGDPSERKAGSADTISRAILTAQRTADALVQEAREAAERTVSEAREQAQKLLSDAQSQAQRAVADAEGEAKRAHEATSQRLLAAIEELEATRTDLRGDVDLLEAHLEEQRLRLRTSIDELQRLLDNPEALRVAPAPELSGREPPATVDEREVVGADDDEAVAVESEPLAGPTAGEGDDGGDERDVTFTASGRAGGRWQVEELSPDVPPTATKAAPIESDASELGPVDEDMAWSRFAGLEGDGGPPTRAYRIEPDDEDDAYLAELRKAMAGDDDPGGALFDQDETPRLADDHRPRSRFGRKR